jgi:PleD family two-component response regulator
MPKKARVLVVDSDLHTLSKIYLSLIHRNYKVEATDNAQEITARVDRFKPRLVILRSSTKNLTQEVYEELARKRLNVLLIADENEVIPVEWRKLEVIQMPPDVTFFDAKIMEILNIVELP